MDLVIREDDGWEELDDLEEAIREGGVRDLWSAAGTGNLQAVEEALDELGFELGGELVGFRLISEPDDMHGESYRAWVRYA